MVGKDCKFFNDLVERRASTFLFLVRRLYCVDLKKIIKEKMQKIIFNFLILILFSTRSI